ncbi:MAG TPA: beta-ketoacyl-ACP synthase III [Candidatus Saccharicenans sp.]|nr:beta-ketoacyl-ACP synthase III [Candidatus Saccharicenans sp.]HOL45632.1 beta-ketoacyl-ACP synthase III [Candidatus Saccharicenans sp.]HOM94528.1 beta-ketoacyl-ACP synthase III [Candidatus Saccharicenans sp.]HOT68730.1 beta-ketoacyl-ACP synthase III [Candidatus Saccharicenans sp.]HPC87916.1 beta-ketoacyl-ACP synthase III [Candidatus Saccharicenans sp.]
MTEKERRIKIRSTGVYLPDKVLTNADLEKMVDTSDEWITTRTGIKERRIVSKEQVTSDLAVNAARMALERGGLKAEDVDLILVATNTPDTIFPATACWVQKKLGIKEIPAFDLEAGCTGLLYALIVAESLILSGTARRILLIGADILTKITNWEDRSTCVLFGDGAGAFILEESDDDSGLISHYWGADGSLAELLILPGGGTLHPANEKTVEKKLHYLTMKGNEVFKHAVKRMGESALEALKRAGLDKSQVDYLIPHQANLRIIDATGERLNLPKEKIVANIHKYGNMSVATIPVALHELAEEGKLQKGQIIVMVAFGAGFTWAAAVYRW